MMNCQLHTPVRVYEARLLLSRARDRNPDGRKPPQRVPVSASELEPGRAEREAP
jgi:hypothetical protein